MQVKRVAGALGAEISGVDLRALSDSQVKEMRAAWLEHLVLFFRDQDLTPEQQLAFGRSFGALHIHPAAPHAPHHPELMLIHADEDAPG